MKQLETIFTADEAAARLRVSKRGLIKIARQYGLCSRDGRAYLFSESDLVAIWETMREPAKAPKPSRIVPALSADKKWERFVELTRKKKPRGG